MNTITFRSLMLAIAVVMMQQAVAQTPTVVTDSRYARGATMAFGRIKTVNVNGGPAIQKRGFCLSETPEPTVNDVVSNKQLSSSGTVYYFDDLKPATKYYMRAYATNQDGVTGYGDIIKFYTIPKGSVTCWYNNGGDEAANTRINEAVTKACDIFSKLTSIKKHFSMGYSAGTPTADCAYRDDPWINMGANASYQRTGTIMHEMQHGLGVIPYSTQWSGDILRSGNGTGEWLGDRVSAFLDFWDNTTGSRLKGDTQHMWPYGINGANEDNGTLALYYANAMIGQALGEDGLQHTYSTFADPYYALDQEDDVKYYIKNESENRGLYTSCLVATATGTLKWQEMTIAEATQNDNAAWYVTFTPGNQYYQFRNAATGQYITFADGAIKTVSKTAPASSENWHLMRGRVDIDGQRGYWMIHPESSWTPKCLQAEANGATTAATFNIANSATAQRWLMMTAAQMDEMAHYAVNQIKKSVNDQLAQLKALVDVPHVERSSGAGVDASVQSVISSFESRLTTAGDVAELSAMVGELQDAATVFLRGVSAADMSKPFDLTYMLENPTVDSNTDGWSQAARVNYQCAEFYQKDIDFYQTLKNLPSGTYAFCVQGFQRPGPYTSAAGVSVNALVIAGNKSVRMAHIVSDAQPSQVGIGDEKTMDGKYVPDNMEAASAYFERGLYENRVLTTVANNGGQLKLWIKCQGMQSGYWVIFDNFRLYFYGGVSIDDVTSVGAVKEVPAVIDNTYYDLQGRRVDTPRKGLYLLNGKKVIIR
ncbi:MAG: hypothetical protein IJ559_02605 [Prevotella sp.]|nr:hypothetical protein [Prevotella sp.]